MAQWVIAYNGSLVNVDNFDVLMFDKDNMLHAIRVKKNANLKGHGVAEDIELVKVTSTESEDTYELVDRLALGESGIDLRKYTSK